MYYTTEFHFVKGEGMAIKLKNNTWKCTHCEQTFPRATLADAHRDTEHDIIYFPISREDLNKLLQFVFSKDDRILSKAFVRTLQLYNRNSSKKQEDV